MARIDQGVRKQPVAADPEALAHSRNREDAPVLERVRVELNLLQGDIVVLEDEDYTASLSDYAILAFSTTTTITITLPSPATVGIRGKHYRVRRAGNMDVTVTDADGILSDTISSGGSRFDALYIAVNVGDVLDPSERYYIFDR